MYSLSKGRRRSRSRNVRLRTNDNRTVENTTFHWLRRLQPISTLPMPSILLGNACHHLRKLHRSLLSAYLASTLTTIPLEVLTRLASSKMALGEIETLVRAIFCGVIMTTVVHHGRNKQLLPILYGIPIFIICGFLHSIAEMFYGALMMFSGVQFPSLKFYLIVIIGNIIGCRLHRLFLPKF